MNVDAAVAYIDSPVCGCVRVCMRACMCVCFIDCIVNLKHLLVKNTLSNFNQTWQDCSMGKGLPKLFIEFHMAKSIDILHKALSSRPSPRMFTFYPWGQN
jgi:hypothetical protein